MSKSKPYTCQVIQTGVTVSSEELNKILGPWVLNRLKAKEREITEKGGEFIGEKEVVSE